MALQNLTVEGFVRELASDSPAPGGGSVAALCGSLGAGLSAMVARLTLGKEKYREHWEAMEALQAEGDQLLARFLSLMEEDTESFNAFMAARKLPKETEGQKAARAQAIQEASKKTALVPLETLKTCADLVRLAGQAVAHGNPNAVTDAGTAALLAEAAGWGAAYNVSINLSGVEDQTFVARCRREVQSALEEIGTRAREIREKLRKDLEMA